MCSNDLSQVCQTPEMTVLAAYEPLAQSGGYQSEAQMEAGLISALQAQGYEYLDIKDEAGLLGNLRACIEVLNNISFVVPAAQQDQAGKKPYYPGWVYGRMFPVR